MELPLYQVYMALHCPGLAYLTSLVSSYSPPVTPLRAPSVPPYLCNCCDLSMDSPHSHTCISSWSPAELLLLEKPLPSTHTLGDSLSLISGSPNTLYPT